MTCTTEKKEKQRRGTYRKDLPCMLKIEEAKRAIPCEKDASVILARLGSGMKWFGKDIGE